MSRSLLILKSPFFGRQLLFSAKSRFAVYQKNPSMSIPWQDNAGRPYRR